MFLCAEMMLQGVAINLVAFARFRGNLQGQAFVLFILTRGRLRGRHRPGPDPDALQASAIPWTSASGRTCARRTSRRPRTKSRCRRHGREEPTAAADRPPARNPNIARRPAMSDIRQYLWLIPAMPLVASALIGLLGPRLLRQPQPLAVHPVDRAVVRFFGDGLP